MGYVSYEYFEGLYPDTLTSDNFNVLEWEARRIIDAHTTGIDNIRKLRVAFPTAEDDVEAVKRCMCKLIKLLHDISQAEKSRGAVQRADGTSTSGPVSSVSSGSESISYASSGGTAIDVAVSDISERNKLLSRTVRECLSGVWDANGVNLLYMGAYPYV